MANVIDNDPGRRSNWNAWRDVVAAWIAAVVLPCALLLIVPKVNDHGPSAHFHPFASVATHAHQVAPDVEGPSNDEQCSDRDYVNERC